MRLTLLLFLSMLVTVSVRAQSPGFENAADQMGVNHVFTGPSLGGGASFADINGDGQADLSLASGPGERVAFYLNEGDAFSETTLADELLDTAESMLSLWADYDNDGDPDLFVGYAERPNQLLRNDGAAGFTDVTESAGLSMETHPPETHKTMAAVWADYDNDGWLDLFVGNWGVPSGQGATNELYRSRGDGTFEEVGVAAGVEEAKQPLAAAFFDYDLDGLQDLYVANDKAEGNQLFRNAGDGTFEDVSESSGADLAELNFHAMGIAVGDYDLDGDFDLYVSNISTGNGLLRNEGDGTFTEVATSAGVSVNKISWSVNFLDVDNDRDLDLFVAVMAGGDGRDELFENVGDGTFGPWSGFVGDANPSFASAVGDYDADGYPDIVVSPQDSPATLWHNTGGTNRWLRVELEGTTSNRDGIGSLIEVHVDGDVLLRTVQGGSGYKSQDNPIQNVGLGTAASVDSVVVRWPSGHVDVSRDIQADRTLTIVEAAIPTESAASPVASAIALTAFPNPFSRRTTLRWKAPATSSVRTLSVYDVLGRRVWQWTLPAGQEAGEVEWAGQDERGHRVAAGWYLYRLEGAGEVVTGKLSLVR